MASLTTSSSSSSWSDLLPDLLGLVLTRLPSPIDCARFRAVCRAWRSAARHHVRQLPWMVFPDGSFSTIGHGGGDTVFYPAGILGLPENATCLGAAADGWLALDCTDDVFRRTHLWDKYTGSGFLQPRCDVKHRHNYQLYNPFTGKIVLLPELDSTIGEVDETFDIRKVLMRCTSPDRHDDQLVAIATNIKKYNIIICRPGKGCCVLDNKNVFDIAFHGDRLYGITPQEELVAFHLAEDDKGAPIVTRCRRVIKKPLADGEEDHWSSMYDDSSNDDDDNNDGGILQSPSSSSDDDTDNDEDEDDSNDGGLSQSSSSSDDDTDNDDEDDDSNDEGLSQSSPSSSDDDTDNDEDDHNDEDGVDETSSQNNTGDNFNVDGFVRSGVDTMYVDDENEERPYDIAITTRRLVQSSRGHGDGGELLMVRHHVESCPGIGTYTLDMDILKADVQAGNWVPVSKLAEGEALFLSRSFSKSIRVYGEIKEGFIYYTDVDDVIDTKTRQCSLIRFPTRCQGADDRLLTWLFPPELQL